jgi:UDP-N-acetylglucosamine 3-dehydrogenase
MTEPRDKIRVAVIGVGAMGWHHARNYSELAGASLVAVADTDLARAQAVAERFHCRAYADHAGMLARESPDAVSIVVPTHLHYRIACDTLNAGVHTLVEKPLTNDLAQAADLVQTASSRRVKFAVGHVERFNPAVQELKRRLDAGELGKLSSLVARRVGVMPPRVKDVDVILDLAVHDIDIAMYLLGREPDEIAVSADHALLSDRFDHSEIFLRFGETGCFIQANWITPIKIRTLSVTGDKGHAEVNYVTQRLEIFQSTLDRQFDDFGDFIIRFGNPQTVAVPIMHQEPLRLELESFIRAIRDDTPVTVDGTEGLKALEVAVRVRESVERGKAKV